MARSRRELRRGPRSAQEGIALCAGIVLALIGVLVPPAHAATLAVGFRDHAYGAAVTAPTADKPQSKLWHAGGRWWGVLWDPAARRYTIQGFNLATQDTHAWTSTGVTVDQRPNSQADALWDGRAQKLYVLTHLEVSDSSTADRGLRVQRFGFSGGTYQLEVTHTVVNRKVESASLDKDSTGRLWVTYTEPTSGGKRVMVAHTTTADTAWVAPFVLPVDPAAVLTSSDDISTVVAYGDSGGGRIGILWSNQRTSAIYFASRSDGAPASSWSMSAVCSTSLCPDDHLNIKAVDADADGRLYAVVKTSLNDKSPRVPGDPLIVVYRLNPSGGWASSVAWTVGEGNMTRPIVVLDSESRRAHVFAVPCCSGGTVYTKDAAFGDLAFPRGNGTVFMRSAVSTEKINNPTSTKQTVDGSTGLLVLASMDSTREYVHNFLPLGESSPPADTTPPTVVATSPADGASGTATGAAVTATFSEPMDASTVTGGTVTLTDGSGAGVVAAVSYDSSTARVTLDPGAELAFDTTYTARVRGGPGGTADSAGNTLESDYVWSFRTASVPVGPETVAVPVSEDSWVHAGRPARNYGAGSLLNVDARPIAVTYLKFDLSDLAGGAVRAATLTVRVTTSGSAGSQAVRTAADDTWDELGVTYADRPLLGDAVVGRLGATGPTLRNTTYSVPLDPAALTPELGGMLTLGLDTASTDGVDLGSRESGWPATLELTVE